MSLPDPHDVAAYDVALAKVAVGPVEPPLTGRIVVSDYDAEWPKRYEREAGRVRAALGDRVARLAHVGSTSVPELPAKPIVDIVLEVPDSADEATYVPDLEAAGYVLRGREPAWFEHRLFRAPGSVNLHVFSAGCSETDRMMQFRDHLRSRARRRRAVHPDQTRPGRRRLEVHPAVRRRED